jgi:hypothetical protein
MKCDESDIYLSNKTRQGKTMGQQREQRRKIEGEEWDHFLPFWVRFALRNGGGKAGSGT